MELDQDAVTPTAGQETVSTDQGSNTQDQSGSDQSADANQTSTEQSSTSEQDAKSQAPKSLSDVVLAAMKGGKEGSSSSEGQSGNKAKTGQVDPNAEAKAAAEKGDGSDVPKEFHKHPAWMRMKSERDAARAEVEQFKQYQSDAQEFQVITGFMSENGIEASEVAETLQWLALRNTDPVEFYKRFSALKDEMDEQMGYTLPPDLQERVDAGEISEEDARALNKAKAEANLHKNRSQQQAERHTTQQTAQQQTALARQMSSTVNQWEKQIQTKDPDYLTKKPFVQDKIRSYIQLYGMPGNSEMALKYALKAYQEVSQSLGSLMPAKKANSPTPQTGKQVETKFTPKSVEDIVSHLLQGGG